MDSAFFLEYTKKVAKFPQGFKESLFSVPNQ